MKSQFEVFARIKPCSSRIGKMTYGLNDNRQMQIYQTKGQKLGHINNTKDSVKFNFTKIFDQECTQEQVFEYVAKPLVNNCLEGYNGTLFAYGQTGSGKTHTMSGAESWQLRGIIPRVLGIKLVFDEFDRRNDCDYKLFISFMEIYNENAYDLLDKNHVELPMENWNRILLQEDDENNIHLKNLSVHNINNEQDGIDLLMMGNFIRQVSSTPLNQTSSRSHCVFTLSIEGKKHNQDNYFVSKIHLVDLAGSERVAKSQVDGVILNEAKFINLSLTYLEQVIIALHERSIGQRTHIPYRNSLLTTILKDSLGGNCKTVMIATLSSDLENTDESISTARFAQRCAQLENEIRKNEKIDLNALILKLEQEKSELQEELKNYQKMVGKIDSTSKLEQKKSIKNSGFDYESVKEKVDNFLNDKTLNLDVHDVNESQLCFQAMKELYNSRMKEYVTELTFISEKLQKYDEILTKKKKKKELENNQVTNKDYEGIKKEAIQKNTNNYLASKHSFNQMNIDNFDMNSTQ